MADSELARTLHSLIERRSDAAPSPSRGESGTRCTRIASNGRQCDLTIAAGEDEHGGFCQAANLPVSIAPATEEGGARVAVIEAQLASLAQRPWKCVRGDDENPGSERRSVMSDDGYFVAEIPECIDEDEDGSRHQAFIAAAPDHVAYLLTELRSSRRREEELRKRVATLAGMDLHSSECATVYVMATSRCDCGVSDQLHPSRSSLEGSKQ